MFLCPAWLNRWVVIHLLSLQTEDVPYSLAWGQGVTWGQAHGQGGRVTLQDVLSHSIPGPPCEMEDLQEESQAATPTRIDSLNSQGGQKTLLSGTS